MPDDTLELSALLDDSGGAEDGYARWMGEREAKGRTAMSAHRILLPMEDDIRPRDSVSGAGCDDSQGSEDIRILEAQLAVEEARAEALQAKREAEQKESAVRISQARLRIAEANLSRSRSRIYGEGEPAKGSTSLSEYPSGSRAGHDRVRDSSGGGA